MAITPLLGFIAENYGWRLAYVFSGSLVLILNIPLVLFVTKDTPQSLGLSPDGDRPADINKTMNSRPPEQSNIAQSSKIANNTGLASLIKRRSLWLICFCFAFIGIGYSVVVNHEVSFMTDMNVSATVAASALGFTVGLTAIASLASGWLADKLSSRYVLILFTLIAIAGMLVLLRADTMSKIWFFVILFGIGVGASGTLLPIITRDIFGSADFSVLFGFTNIFFVIGCAAGAPLAGFMFDVTGSYHAIFVIVTTIFIGSILAIYFAFGAAPKPLLRHPALKEMN